MKRVKAAVKIAIEQFPGCSVFMEDARGLVSSLTLERAAALLIPILTAEPDPADPTDS